jgi:exopolysaccharide biosynthesis protein
MQEQHRKYRYKKWITIALTIIFICIALYKLADRYLIDHVEIGNAFTTTSGADNQLPETVSGQSDVVEQETMGKNNSTELDIDTPNADNIIPKITPLIDDWNYITESEVIKIKKVTEGTDTNTITYYVADVAFKNIESLKAAFAENKFGTNIVQDTSVIAADNNALFAINGDYYGFREDGIIIRNGKIFRDVPARMGMAIYNDGTMKTYDENTTSANELLDSGVIQTLSFGPILVSNSIPVTDFGRTVIDTNFGNHPIENANPRTGVGMISANHFIFIVVDGRSTGYSKGMTLNEFAKTFADLGCTEAYNLDGGGSSTMYFQSRVVNNPLGKGKERGVSDILYVKPSFRD